MAKLTFRLTPGESLDFSLHSAVTRLGRHASNEIVINNTWISSFHAEFRRGEDGVIALHDLNSSNGTTVNGEAIAFRSLSDGDRIGFGQVEAVYLAEFTPPAPLTAAAVREVFPGAVASVAAPRPVKASATPPKAPAPTSPPVISRAMSAPPATIAYDTVRREGTLELEALAKKLDDARRDADEAVGNRDAAETALAKIRGELEAAGQSRQEAVEGRDACRILLEEEKKSLSSQQEAGLARLAALQAEMTALTAEQDRLVESAANTGEGMRAEVLSAQNAIAVVHEQLRTMEGELVLKRDASTAQQKLLAAGQAALDCLGNDLATMEIARQAAMEVLRDNEFNLQTGRAHRQRQVVESEETRRELEKLEAAASIHQEESEHWKRESSQWPIHAAAAREELTGLQETLSRQRQEVVEGEHRESERKKHFEDLEAKHATLGTQVTKWAEQEAAAALMFSGMAEQQRLSGKLRQEIESNRAAVSGSIAALSAVEARRQVTDEELTVLQTRLVQLRLETQGAEALNSKVLDLRQQQAEAERRLAFLDDRLSGMSEAPDPNWGTVHSLARSFIRKLDLIDDLMAHLASQPDASGTVDQLRVFRAGLIDILKEYSIEAYSLEPGTVIDVAARKRIQIVETLSEGSHNGTRVVRTYRPGYVCLNGDLGISTLLRKADVAVSIPLG